MTLSKYTSAISSLLLLLLVALPTSRAVQSAHVHVRIKTAPGNSSTDLPAATSDTTATAADPTLKGYEIGEWTKVDPEQYHIASCVPQVWNVTRKDVASLSLRFTSIQAPGDHVIVSALDGSFPQVFDEESKGVTTVPIQGNALKIEFRPSKDSKTGCAATGKLPSFTLDAVGIEWSQDMLVMKESVCGADTMKEARCALDVDDTIYKRSKAVMRASFSEDDKEYVCTAWLWGNKGHIVSNNHCFSSQATVDTATFKFMMQSDACDETCDASDCGFSKILVGKDNVKFIQSDPALDYAVLQIVVDPEEYVRPYGYLRLRADRPVLGEEIYIVQHPHGDSKKIAMTDDDDDASTAILKEVSKKDGKRFPDMVGYTADTEGGSSGSPVLSRKDHLVVGLHHHGGCENYGTPSHRLVAPLRAIADNNDGFKR